MSFTRYFQYGGAEGQPKVFRSKHYANPTQKVDILDQSMGWEVMAYAHQVWEENDDGVVLIKNRSEPTRGASVDLEEFFWVKMASKPFNSNPPLEVKEIQDFLSDEADRIKKSDLEYDPLGKVITIDDNT